MKRRYPVNLSWRLAILLGACASLLFLISALLLSDPVELIADGIIGILTLIVFRIAATKDARNGKL